LSVSRVVVLGGDGFIGRHVLATLQRDGVDVCGIGLAPRSEVSGVRWLQRDLDRDDLGEISAEVCIHLAECSTLTDTVAAVQNLERARAVLGASFDHVIYASSAVVYGDHDAAPHGEADPVAPRGTYAKAKLAVETELVRDARCIAVRLANVYGEGMSKHNVLSDLLAQRESDGPIRLRDLGPVRDYVHVRDVARAFLALVRHRSSGVINVGTGVGTSVADLCETMCALVGRRGRALVATAPRSEPSALVVDYERLQRLTGWSPEITVEAGLAELIGR
jgi:nucleoside-diphosphate-sugar epimerase